MRRHRWFARFAGVWGDHLTRTISVRMRLADVQHAVGTPAEHIGRVVDLRLTLPECEELIAQLTRSYEAQTGAAPTDPCPHR